MNNDKLNRIIVDFVSSYQKQHQTQTNWRQPIIGFASAENSLFDQYKKIIRSSHATPKELLPGAKSVVVYFIPFEKNLHRENAASPVFASRSWAVAYVETNQLISDLNQHIKNELSSNRYQAALVPPTHNFDKKTLMSDWSHRHMAYAAGIGSFGTNNLLITAKGCSGRVGSLVTDLAFEPSQAQNGENCLTKAGQQCLKCVKQCAYDALHADGFDRHACYRQLLLNDRHHKDLGLTDVCGKCAAMVPCSVTNPVKKLNKGS
jgi:epoxyqueuosine reductase QueG